MKIRQRGNALLLALLLVTVCTIIVVAVFDDQSIALLSTQALWSQTQIEGYARGVNVWATQLLSSDIYKEGAKQHTLLQWPKTLQYTTEEGVNIQGTLYDAQAFYNLNNLSDPNYQAGFLSLLQTVDPELDLHHAEDLLRATTSWLNPLGKQSDIVADSTYLQANPPYRAAHRFFISPTEWRWVDGVDAMFYQRLAPNLIALPRVTPVNINTAPAIVLMSLSSKMSLAQANSIITARIESEGFESTDELSHLPAVPKINSELITTESKYFLLRTDIEWQKQHFLEYTLYERNAQSDTDFSVKLLWQSKGTL
jgi:general secretion pathway protein K